ncbi:hypothetical protein MY11210_005123 [Beauveria gryllotalpidicola]
MERYFDLADNSPKVGIHIQIGNCWTPIRSGALGCAFVVTTAAAMVYNNIAAATAGFTSTLALQIKGTLSKLLGRVSAIRMGITAADRVIALTEVPTEPNTGRRIADWPSHGTVEVKGVTVKYGPYLPPALKDVSLSARLVSAAHWHRWTDRCWKSLCISFAALSNPFPQDPVLFSGTLRANIDPFADKTDEQVQAVLERVRLVRDKLTQPSEKPPALSLETTIESGATNLSHGERGTRDGLPEHTSVQEFYVEIAIVVSASMGL